MKQIEYTEKQLLVLEILEKIDKVMKPRENAYDFEKLQYFNKISEIKKAYGIVEKYQTLREFIDKNSCGAYHHFNFTIDNLKIRVCDVHDFERLYNSSLLDKYYVLFDKTETYGSNCENYDCEHNLELVIKED